MIESVHISLAETTHLNTTSLDKRSGFFMGKIVSEAENGTLFFKAPGLKLAIPAFPSLKVGMSVKIEIRNGYIVSFQNYDKIDKSVSEVSITTASTNTLLYNKIAHLTGKTSSDIQHLWEGENLSPQAYVFKTAEKLLRFLKEKKSAEKSFFFKQNGGRLYVFPFCLGEDKKSIHGSIRRYLPDSQAPVTFISAKSSIGKLTFYNIDSDTVSVLLYSNIRKELSKPLMIKLSEIFKKEVLYSEEANLVIKEDKFWTLQEVDIRR